MKIWATHTYVNSFEMEVPDDATEEEIINLIENEDNEYLSGDWDCDWTIEDDDEEEE